MCVGGHTRTDRVRDCSLVSCGRSPAPLSVKQPDFLLTSGCEHLSAAPVAASAVAAAAAAAASAAATTAAAARFRSGCYYRPLNCYERN